MTYFDGLLQNPDPVIVDAASTLENITAQFQASQLTEEEYRELCLDVLDMQRIDELALDLQRKQDIQKAFQELYQIVSFVAGHFL